jgi:hypothetical protein
LLPADKLSAIGELQNGSHVVGMVGDGINDAPTLAKSQIGFAMAAAGTGTAIETADVALMDDDLRKISAFVRLSRQTAAILKQNILFALGIKAVFLVFTLMGFATMWMEVFADVGRQPVGRTEWAALAEKIVWRLSMKERLHDAILEGFCEARVAIRSRDYGRAYHWLERTHILTQRRTLLHSKSHVLMLFVGIRAQDPREVLGQIPRVIAALLFSRVWVPRGNTGRARISAFQVMTLSLELESLLDEE